MRYGSGIAAVCLTALVPVGPATADNNDWPKETWKQEKVIQNQAEFAREQQKSYDEQRREGWRRQQEFDRAWHGQYAKLFREEAKRSAERYRVRGLANGYPPVDGQPYSGPTRGRTVRISGSVTASTVGPISFTSQAVVVPSGPVP
jgi:hypothetical protein